MATVASANIAHIQESTFLRPTLHWVKHSKKSALISAARRPHWKAAGRQDAGQEATGKQLLLRQQKHVHSVLRELDALGP